MKEYIISVQDDERDFEEVFIAHIRKQTELIRCRDCKAYNGMKCVRNNMIAVMVNDYCSRAERKEE